MQEAFWKATKTWVEEANKNNVDRMHQESKKINNGQGNSEISHEVTIQSPTKDETWQVLADCQITLPLARLLKLVLRFTETIATIITKKGSE